MDHDTFFELISSERKLSLVEQAALAAHESECASCRADREALDEAEEDEEIETVDPAVLKKEVDAIFAKAAARKQPRRMWFQPLAMAACLVVAVGVSFVGGRESAPQGLQLPERSLDEFTDRLWLAQRALDMGDMEDAHDLARKLVDDPRTPPPVKREAQAILAAKKK